MEFITKYGQKLKAIRIKCEYCKEDFLAREYLVKKNNVKFCSIKCSNSASKTNQVELICGMCKKNFKRNKYRANNTKSGLHFCSRECKDKSQIIENNIVEVHPNHYITGISTYRIKAFKYYDNKCDICGYDKFPDLLHVHHIDKNRKNNRINKLRILCQNCHAEIHYLMGKPMATEV